MNRLLKFFALLVLITPTIFDSSGQGFLRTDGTRIVNDKGENILLRGFGLGGWMLQEGYMLRVYDEGQQHKIRNRIQSLIGEQKTKEFYDLWLANHTRKVDIDSLKRWGFNSVRLPLHYNLFTLPIEKESTKGQHTWLPKGFAMIDSLLAWCKANELYLILDLHAAPGGQGTDANISDRDPDKPSLWEDQRNQEKTVALWSKLAERYSNEPWIGGYDIINEPNWGFTDYENDKNGLQEKNNVPLRKLLVDITNAIRKVDQKHIIIIEGNGWGNNYNGMLPVWDKNMVLSFHKYWNYNDEGSIKHILETREKNNVPVWLGETGENSNVWFRSCIALLEKNNIGWAWWPLKKLGNNNPLEVKSNADYDKVLAYWAKTGPKPDVASATKGIMEVANALKLENNIYHPDVVDAMMRQPRSSETKPFVRHEIKNGAVIKVVNYDIGKIGKAYYDADSANYWVAGGPRGGNQGNAYRNDGVDVYRDSLNSEEFYIGNIEAGEWWQFTTNVVESGTYRIKFTYSATREHPFLSMTSNGKSLKDKVLMSNTHGWHNWSVAETKNVSLKEGKNVLRIYANTPGFNLKSLEFVLMNKNVK
jgi:endoglucanase